MILTRCGYDNNYAFEAISEENIVKIESFANENTHILKKTNYEKSVPFKFLPGHRAIILDIPRKIAELKNKQANKQTETSAVSSISPDREEQLKNLLISKLKNYSIYVKFELKFEKEHLIEFQNIGDRLKCRVKCPICPKNYLCNYKKHWSVSNIEAHIKEHSVGQNFSENSTQQITSQLASQATTSSSNLSVVSPANLPPNLPASALPSALLPTPLATPSTRPSIPTSIHAAEAMVNAGNTSGNIALENVHRISNEQFEALNKILQKKNKS